jgi:LDH2 family malate/lactate/ureidoglycolate dehydrogenase
VAVVTLRGVVHIGRVGEYAELAAERGCVALVWCSGGPPGGNVAPFGGRGRILGTNPVAYAFPAGSHEPVVADFSTSVSAEGKIRVHRQSGRALPDGWIVDADGSPSNDPAVFYDGGAILPAAGHKGFALGLLVELLGGIVAGAGCASLGVDPGNGVVFLVLDAARLGLDLALVDAVIEAVEAVPPAPGFERVTVPGRPEARSLEQRSRDGIPCPRETWRLIAEAARSVGVDVEAP